MIRNGLNIPLVSVIMPVYNAGKFLKESIESILNQTYASFEFIIINDGSSDNSEKIILSYSDSRIRYIKNEQNLKLISTLNKGMKLANGKYIIRMDADDISLPERIEKQVSFMENNYEIGVCGTWFEAFNSTNSAISKYKTQDTDIRISMLYQCPFCHPSVIIRNNIIKEYGFEYNHDYSHAEDYELWTRIAKVTRFANLPEVLLRYRIHDNNISNLENHTQLSNTNRIIKNQFKELGIELDTDNHKILNDIVYSTFIYEKDFIISAENLLMNILKTNNKSEVLPIDSLNKFFAEKWFHLCINTTSLGYWVLKKYSKSELSEYYPITLKEKLKFVVKSILRL